MHSDFVENIYCEIVLIIVCMSDNSALFDSQQEDEKKNKKKQQSPVDDRPVVPAPSEAMLNSECYTF